MSISTSRVALFFKSLTLLLLMALSVSVSPVTAQVFDSGPSDPALFDTVINLPPDPDIGDDQSIGGDGLTTQLNVADGGTVGEEFTAGAGSEVNISGGMVGGPGTFFLESFSANAGSEVNISGGVLNVDLVARSGSVVNIGGGNVARLLGTAGSEINISGGTLGPDFNINPSFEYFIDLPDGGYEIEILPASAVTVIGGEFRLNNAPFAGETITLVPDDVFSGTLADGSPFIFVDNTNSTAEVTLVPAILAASDLDPMVVDANTPIRPSGLRAGQSLTLQAGGELDRNFQVVNATLNIEGGELRPNAEAVGSEVNISGGTVSADLQAFHSVVNISGGVANIEANSGSELNLSGGFANIDANSGSEVNISGGSASGVRSGSAIVVNISGGSVGGVGAARDSEVNITGGHVGGVSASAGSEVNISGGTLGRRFRIEDRQVDAELIGGEFQLNNAPFTGTTFTLETGDVFTGTLADGSAFIFASTPTFETDSIKDIALTTVALPPLDLTPIIVDTVNPLRPSGLRTGQSLTLQAGGELGDNFEIVNATLNIEGGTLGSLAGASDSVVNIRGGIVGEGFRALEGSVVNISGGVVGDDFNAFEGSVVNISGGTVPQSFRYYEGSVVNISGGVVPDVFDAASGTITNLSGSDFVLDGVPVDGLVPGEAFTITDRLVTLSGRLADGTEFSFTLSPRFPSEAGCCVLQDVTTLTVTLVEPFLLGDVNQDGLVDFLDIAPFIDRLSSGTFQDEADIDRSGGVDFLDVSPFIGLLSS